MEGIGNGREALGPGPSEGLRAQWKGNAGVTEGREIFISPGCLYFDRLHCSRMISSG